MSFFPWLRACLLILLLILVLKFFFRPLSNIRLPINSTFSTPIHLHNPHFTTLRILEIFSSDCNIQLEFPTEFLIKSNNSIKSVKLVLIFLETWGSTEDSDLMPDVTWLRQSDTRHFPLSCQTTSLHERGVCFTGVHV
ncbi:unnamed protein product [Meloidogyne enterolobii]|uniref:Uncharacterized protein n=1 Tax=Meloidogyne enterolobii TaxID=390850 RepID=A0ACB0ZDQ4_MELEN